MSKADATTNPHARASAILQAMKPQGATSSDILGFYRSDGQWIDNPQQVRDEIGKFQRAYDDTNHSGGINTARAQGFLGAFVPRFPEARAPSGARWSVTTALSGPDGLAAFDESLALLRCNKAVSLLPVSKEMLQFLSTDARRAFAQAHAETASPDADGVHTVPSRWKQQPISFIDKKERSFHLGDKRQIAKLDTGHKLHGALHLPAYRVPVSRIRNVQSGWGKGECHLDAVLCGSTVIEQALLLKHDLICFLSDIKTFFPAMDRDFVLISEAWHGLSPDIQQSTLSLYHGSICRPETAHGLATLDFELLRTKTGFVMGCLLSTEKAKLFINSLVEAIGMATDGVRLWNGRQEGCRMDSTLSADDMLCTLSSWRAFEAVLFVTNQWREVSASSFGVKGFNKSCYIAMSFDAQGTPCEAVLPDWLKPSIGNEPLPRAPISFTFTHLGDRRSVDGNQSTARGRLKGLLRAWLRKIGRIRFRRFPEAEFAHLSNVGIASLIGTAPLLGLTFDDGEIMVEKERRRLFRHRFPRSAQLANADKYLFSDRGVIPRLGAILDAHTTSNMTGEGWFHASSLSGAALHDQILGSAGSGADSQSRRWARSQLDLVAYEWGMRGFSTQGTSVATWDMRHLRRALGKHIDRHGARTASIPTSQTYVRRSAYELFLLHLVVLQEACKDAWQGSYMRVEHDLEANEAWHPCAPHHLPQTQDDLELFRGALLGKQACAQAKRQREPVHVLLAAGVVVRSQVCTDDGSAIMSYAEACAVIPDLRPGDAVAKRAWAQLRIDLLRMGIKPVPREPTFSARQLWGSISGDGTFCLQDGTRATSIPRPRTHHASRNPPDPLT